MEGRLSLVVFTCLIVASSMLHGSSGQTTHVVGDALGWVVPPGGDITYRIWATTKTFVVGDVLVFNFITNQHTVAEVSTDAFDSCNATGPMSLSGAGPTNITLKSVGEHHFICSIAIHCSLGQKLSINVSATPTSETAPSPASIMSMPSPSRVGMTYTVGDSLGWVLPPGGPIAYQTWARSKSFMVGDILVFNFMSGAHDVISVTRAEFESCTISATATPPTTTSPARIPLTSGGEHYYICTFTQHCSLGQKIAINVIGDATATPSSSSATSPRSSKPTTPSIPSPVSAPPPPSSHAPSCTAVALPFTFLAVALTFL